MSRGLNEKEVDEQYITSLYWAFTTMTTTGYGDITPITNIEKLFVIFCMLVSCVVFAYVVGSIESVIRKQSVIEEQFKDKILHVSQFLLHRNIPRKLRLEVKKYLNLLQNHKKQQKLAQSEILSMLNKNLEEEVKIHLLGLLVRKQRFLCQTFDEKVQAEIVFLIKQQNYMIDDNIFEEGDREDKNLEDVHFGPESEIIASEGEMKNQRLYFVISG